MGLALGTAVDALAGKVAAVFHTHDEEEWDIAEWTCV